MLNRDVWFTMINTRYVYWVYYRNILFPFLFNFLFQYQWYCMAIPVSVVQHKMEYVPHIFTNNQIYPKRTKTKQKSETCVLCYGVYSTNNKAAFGHKMQWVDNGKSRHGAVTHIMENAFTRYYPSVFETAKSIPIYAIRACITMTS